MEKNVVKLQKLIFQKLQKLLTENLHESRHIQNFQSSYSFNFNGG